MLRHHSIEANSIRRNGEKSCALSEISSQGIYFLKQVFFHRIRLPTEPMQTFAIVRIGIAHITASA